MITSSHNSKVAHVRALLNRREERDASHQFVVEGVRLTEEGLITGIKPDLVFFSSDLSARGRQIVEAYQSQKTDVEELSPAVLQQISSTETSAGLLAVFSKPTIPFPKPLTFLVIADALRDPGNLGTLLRTAIAAGVQGIALTPTCVDVFSPKVVRSGMGAHFRLPLQTLDWDEIRSVCQSQPEPLRLLLAEAENATSCWDMDLRIPLALIIGSEAEGATPKARKAADELIAIPMPGKSESLNAAVAAAILIFEVVRQRSS